MVRDLPTAPIQADATRYITLDVGDPPQKLQFDLDMLAPDFYTALTTSGSGSKYDTFASKTFSKSSTIFGLSLTNWCRDWSFRSPAVQQLSRPLQACLT